MAARSDASVARPARPADPNAAGADANTAESWVDRKAVFTRTFDAPRELVFRAWTDPEHVQRWWGPHGFTNPRCEWDARPGGTIHIDMTGPDGAVYPMTGRFQEVEPPQRLVFTSAALDDAGKAMFEVRNTVTFHEQGGKTMIRLEAVVIGVTAPVAGAYLRGMNEGWSQALDRLASHVATTASDREMVATRVFDAPRDLVFKAWSDPQHLAQWWGPKGFTTTTHSMDFRPGGVWRFVMHGPDGTDYPNKITFVEIVEPRRIAYQHGGDGELVHFQVTVEFEPEGADRTRLNMRMVFPSAAAKNATEEKYGAIEGQRQTLNRLANYLARM
jgi:uncharacterized protein YndB with AHSA1/START domain